jgi:hypothetical protein
LPLSDDEIFQKYNNAMSEYASKVFPAFPRYLDSQRQPYLLFLKMVHDFYLFCSYLVEHDLIPENKACVPLRTLFAKASLALYGIYLTLNNGLDTEASVLLRSLFESYLNMKLILSSDIDERMKLYDDFRFVERWNNLQANRNLLATGKLSQKDFESTYSVERIDEVERDYNIVKINYHPKQPYHWAWKIFRHEIKRNPSIKFISGKLGLSFDYVKLYSTLSISVHASPCLINDVGVGSSISLAPNFTNSIYNSGVLAVDYMASIIEELATYFKYAEPDEISKYVSAYSLAVMNEANRNKVNKSTAHSSGTT